MMYCVKVEEENGKGFYTEKIKLVTGSLFRAKELLKALQTDRFYKVCWIEEI